MGLKIRFEVFKRDGFKCQYCGRTPPDVVLEVDHIIPKAEGGEDSIDNYITACFDCNRGKGKNSLTNVPESINNRMAELAEKRDQIQLYSEYLTEIEVSAEIAISNINQLFNHYYPGYSLSDRFNNSTLKTFIKHLPVKKIKDALTLASNRFPDNDEYWREKAVLYFCGICWNWIKKPETRDW